MKASTSTLAEVLKDNPQFHKLSDIHAELDPSLTSWAARLDTLEAMRAHLQPGMQTLETGCGHSTVMFALSGVQHRCITPAGGEAERVKAFCRDRGIDDSQLQFMIGNSQDELSKLPPDLKLDFVFIDGGHFFPIPCIDWYYADFHLKEGGILVLDDVRIPTVRMVYDFMHADTNWEQIQLIDDTIYFRKLRCAPNLHDWFEQAYNRSFPDWSFLPLSEQFKLKGKALEERARAQLRPLKRWLGGK